MGSAKKSPKRTSKATRKVPKRKAGKASKVKTKKKK